ncbi:MAG: LL-diaminopimelate aminotransferase [Euryarchaeota archaeon]|nr:LL-diaminopimelate aminotransferase [Euryarchaeota archaeon]
MDYARRIQQLPRYLFAELDAAKQQARQRGVDVIDLGVGDPDLPTPRHIVEALARGARDPSTHQYPSYEGDLEFREAVARMYRRVHGVRLDPHREVIALIGSKEGIAHAPLAFINPGERVLVPDPGYPVYRASTILAGGRPVEMPLREKNGFLPDLSKVRGGARLMFLNYPNNPTAAVAPRGFLREAVDFCRDRGVHLLHDFAYGEMGFDVRPPSVLSVPGARDAAVEFHSLSKTYCMTGWRLGFAVGNAELLAGLLKVKTNIDSGAFRAVQRAGIAALNGPRGPARKSLGVYRERRDLFVEGLRRLGLRFHPPRATFYVWVRVPRGSTSLGFSGRLLEGVGVVATPGVGFGRHGEGYVRFSLTKPRERIREALERMEDVLGAPKARQ